MAHIAMSHGSHISTVNTRATSSGVYRTLSSTIEWRAGCWECLFQYAILQCLPSAMQWWADCLEYLCQYAILQCLPSAMGLRADCWEYLFQYAILQCVPRAMEWRAGWVALRSGGNEWVSSNMEWRALHVYIYIYIHICMYIYIHISMALLTHSYRCAGWVAPWNGGLALENVNESWHTYQCVMAHISMSHSIHMNESWCTYQFVVSHIGMSHRALEIVCFNMLFENFYLSAHHHRVEFLESRIFSCFA